VTRSGAAARRALRGGSGCAQELFNTNGRERMGEGHGLQSTHAKSSLLSQHSFFGQSRPSTHSTGSQKSSGQRKQQAQQCLLLSQYAPNLQSLWVKQVAGVTRSLPSPAPNVNSRDAADSRHITTQVEMMTAAGSRCMTEASRTADLKRSCELARGERRCWRIHKGDVGEYTVF
jgi:hypothetical protein